MKNKNGFTFIEAIITIGILGVVISPVMSMFVLSARINRDSKSHYNSMLTAQGYMEEVKAKDSIDIEDYEYNQENGWYERKIMQTEDEYGALIRIVPERDLLYTIEVIVMDNGQKIDAVKGSKIIR